MNASRRHFLKMSGMAAGLLATAGAQRALGGSRVGLTSAAARDDQAIFDQVSALAEAYIAQFKLPGISIGILHHDELLFMGAYGLKNTTTGQPYHVEDVQCLESISKSVAATAIMQLVEDGRMDIDLPLTHYLPDFWLTDPRYAQITVRHILGHSSGIPFALPSEEALGPFGEFMNPYPGPDAAEQLVAAMAAEPITLLSDPGVGFNYSDMAYDLLAAVIYSVSGERFEDYCQAHIFGPLGMAHTTFMLPKVDPNRLVQSHVLDSAGNPVVSEIYPYALQRAPSCTLHSNVADMSRWVVANLNHDKFGQARILKTANQKKLWQPMDMLDPSAGFDYGWGCIMTDFGGTPEVAYYGGMLVQTAIAMLPKHDMAAIAFSNLDAPWVVGDIPYMALTWMLDGKCCRPATPVGQLRLNAWKNGQVH